MALRARKKTSQVEPGEAAWRRQPPPKRRPKIRQNRSVITQLRTAGGLPFLKLARPRLPRLSGRQWLLLPALALLIFGVIQVFTNDHFFVFSADVHGTQRVAPDQVYAASGIDGKNILWVAPRAVAARVMAVPGVALATVHVWPPNKVVIDIQEQAPLVVWKVGDKVTWVAEDGRPMPAVGPPPALNLIDAGGAAAVLPANAETTEPAETDRAGAASDPVLRPGVLAGLKALHARRPDLVNVSYGREEGLYFVAAPGGWTVYLGEDGNIAARLELLAAAQPTLAAEKVKPAVVDLRLDKRVIYR